MTPEDKQVPGLTQQVTRGVAAKPFSENSFDRQLVHIPRPGNSVVFAHPLVICSYLG